MAKRAYKLQEFVAHSSNVNCLKIGRRSSGVLVTGGDDKKVNMWAIGKPDSIMVGCPIWTPSLQRSSLYLITTWLLDIAFLRMAPVSHSMIAYDVPEQLVLS